MPEMRSVTISSIDANPWQPRDQFTKGELDELADSIREYGILQPLVVSEKANNRYQLIAGERRLRAAKQAGLTKVFVVVREADEQESLALALVENIQRKNLNPIERAKAYRRLIDEFHLTQAEVSQKMGKARSAIANTLRLLELPEKIRDAVIAGRISEGHAKAIAGLSGTQQIKFFERVVEGNFSVRDTEKAVRKIQEKGRHQDDEILDGENFTDHYRQLLEGELSTKVEIKESKGTGEVAIHFYSEEELQRVVKKILRKEEEE